MPLPPSEVEPQFANNYNISDNFSILKDITYGIQNTFLRGCFLLLLRIGFIFIQIGSIPAENIYELILHNLIDIVVSVTSFSMVGYHIAYGKDFRGLVGYSYHFTSDDIDFDKLIFGLSASMTSSAILTTMTASRIHIACCIISSFLNSAFTTPILMHWAWTPKGWMARKENFFNSRVALKDHAGGLLVHYSSGLASLIAAVFLGRRLIRLSEIHECSIPPSSPGTVLMSYFLVILGLAAFSLPTPDYEAVHLPFNYSGVLFLNYLLAFSGASMIVTLLTLIIYRNVDYWKVIRCLQGGLAGVVAVSAGIDIYYPVISFLIGIGTGFIFNFAHIIIFKTPIEDYCNVIAGHLFAGFVSTMLPPLLGTAENLGIYISWRQKGVHAIWQLCCLLAVTGFCVVVWCFFFTFFSCIRCLRNPTEYRNHIRSIVLTEKKNFFQRLFVPEDDVPYFEPGYLKYKKNSEEIASRFKNYHRSSISKILGDRRKKKFAREEPIYKGPTTPYTYAVNTVTEKAPIVLQRQHAVSLNSKINEEGISSEIKSCYDNTASTTEYEYDIGRKVRKSDRQEQTTPATKSEEGRIMGRN